MNRERKMCFAAREKKKKLIRDDDESFDSLFSLVATCIRALIYLDKRRYFSFARFSISFLNFPRQFSARHLRNISDSNSLSFPGSLQQFDHGIESDSLASCHSECCSFRGRSNYGRRFIAPCILLRLSGVLSQSK